MRIGDLLAEHVERNPSADAEVFSVSERLGVVPQRHLFVKTVATEDRSRYRRVAFGDIVYNPYLLWNKAVGTCFEKAGGCVSPVYIVLRPKVSGIERFLHYFLRSEQFASSVDAIATGSVTRRRTVPLEKVLDLEFELPAISLQRAANQALTLIDSRMDIGVVKAEVLENIASELFSWWFIEGRNRFDILPQGDVLKRLHERLATEFPWSENTNHEQWRLSTLGEEIERTGGFIQTGPFGSQLHASDYVTVGVPVIMPKDISRRRVVADSIARISEVFAMKLKRHRVREGDIVFSRRGDIEKHALISRRENGWLCGTGCLLVRPGSAYPSPSYLSLSLAHPKSRAWLRQHAVGATMLNLNARILARVPVIAPPKSLLDIFESIVSKIERSIVANDEQVGMARSIRQFILPLLFSDTSSK